MIFHIKKVIITTMNKLNIVNILAGTFCILSFFYNFNILEARTGNISLEQCNKLSRGGNTSAHH